MKKKQFKCSSVNVYPFVGKIAKKLHGHQKKCLSLLLSAIVFSGTVNTYILAQQIAEWTKTLFESAKKRIYRFIGNTRVNDVFIYEELAKSLLAGVKGRPVISVDWTEWHSNLRVLAATLTVARRSVVIFAQSCVKNRFIRSQNSMENAFLTTLLSFSPSAEESRAFV